MIKPTRGRGAASPKFAGPAASWGRWPAPLVAYLFVLAFGVLAPSGAIQAQSGDSFSARRDAMVRLQIEARGIHEPRLLDAMRSVPRHRFVPDSYRNDAYNDHALQVEEGQSLSQPYTVALMTELLELKGTERILEIGTGSGYHTAILAQLADRVYSIEIVGTRAIDARRRLQELGFRNIEIRVGNGYKGWPEKAPFDAIVLTAATQEPPVELLEQLKVGGRMVVPVGGFLQELQVITRSADGFERREVEPVRFGQLVEDPRDN